MERVNEDATFACSDGDVEMEVTVGEGQLGRISMEVEDGESRDGTDTLRMRLGRCTDLEDVAVMVRVLVNVVNPLSGRTSVTCVIDADGAEQEATFPGPELAVGEPVLFRIRYTREQP